MKFIVHVCILLLAVYGAFRLYEDHAPEAWPRLAAAGAEPEPVSAPAVAEPAVEAWRGPVAATQSAPEAGQTRITCPTCDGEGRLTYADRRGGNHSYPCPICNMRGFRDVRVGTGQAICPDCKGWGRTEKIETRRGLGGEVLEKREGGELGRTSIAGYKIGSRVCRRCNQSGLVQSAQGRASSTPTPGVQTPRSSR